MKINLFIILLIFSFESNAQLAPVGSKWVYEGRSFGSGIEYHHSEYTITKDTLIEGKKYSEIKPLWASQGYYMTFDSGNIYYYQNAERQLFFDFNAQKGDTIYVDCRTEYNGDSIIKNFPVRIDSIYWFVTPLKDSLLSYKIRGLKETNGISEETKVITEKLIFGSEYHGGTHFGPTLFQHVFEYDETFKCYHEPAGISVELVSNCDRVGIDEIIHVNDYIDVYPNPANHVINIMTTNTRAKLAQIILYNMLGDEIRKIPVQTSNNFEIQTDQFTSGVYFVVVELQSGERAVKKIIIQN